ncbi:hypothetical protein Bca4012_065538 [Brassica carinata]
MLGSAIIDLGVAGWLRLQVGYGLLWTFGSQVGFRRRLATSRNGQMGRKFGYGRRFGKVVGLALAASLAKAAGLAMCTGLVTAAGLAMAAG